jgi:hypothetical protein
MARLSDVLSAPDNAAGLQKAARAAASAPTRAEASDVATALFDGATR